MGKKTKKKTGHISDAISSTDFIFGTKVEGAYNDKSDTDLNRRSRSKVKVKFSPKLVKN